MIVEVDRATSDTTSQVLLIDAATGAQLCPTAPFGPTRSATPFTVIDNEGKTAETYSIYLQDEWKLTHNLTLNYGAALRPVRWLRRRRTRPVPRVNLVWLPTPTHHVPRSAMPSYFTPPPFELVAQESVQKFIEPIPGRPDITSTGSPVVAVCGALVATTACPLVSEDTTPHRRARRLLRRRRGAEVRLAPDVTVDSYLKLSHHLIDEGQFGAPIILTPFNYAKRPPVRRRADRPTTPRDRSRPTRTSPTPWRKAKAGIRASSTFRKRRSTTWRTTTSTSTTTSGSRSPPAASYLWQGTRFGGDLIFGTGLGRTATCRSERHVHHAGRIAARRHPQRRERPATTRKSTSR